MIFFRFRAFRFRVLGHAHKFAWLNFWDNVDFFRLDFIFRQITHC